MSLKQRVSADVKHRVRQLRTMQQGDGSWRFCFEGAPLTDCSMLLLIHALELPEQALSHRLTDRLISMQQPNGGWKLYDDETEGNLSATVQAYAALLSSGRFTRQDTSIQKAERFIRTHGGLSRAHFMTKYMLAVHGLYPYPKYVRIPMALFLLPSYTPLNIYEFSNYARVHLTPMIICLNKKLVIPLPNVPDMSDLAVRQEDDWLMEHRSSLVETIVHEGKRLIHYPNYLQQQGYKAAEQFMLSRIEDNGTLYSYASSTFYMIYALLALGYDQTSPVIQKAIEGLLSLSCETRRGLHIQNSPSAVWDTALISYSLQEAGIAASDPMIDSASRYLQTKQHVKRGDWSVHVPDAAPGGWGFSPVNTFVPDNDDTSAVLRALARGANEKPDLQTSWNAGLQWMIAMQNSDGGWGAFEKDANNAWLTLVPLENAADAIVDDSSADVTGRVLECLGNYAGIGHDHPRVKRAVNWLVRHQEADGSWYGKWGICYIYGTWAAITGLCAAGYNDKALKRAVNWLESIQHPDGSWGESCQSSEVKQFTPLSFGTPSQTAWAVDALLAYYRRDTPAIQKGISYLLQQSSINESASEYPTGLGLPGGFYIRYESYNYLFPLLALAHYMKYN